MNLTHIAALQILFSLARSNRPADLSVVAGRLSLSCVEADRVLEELARAGLADADRVRLTMAGLCVAVARPRVPVRAKRLAAA
ncbi:MAG: hypothetical protein HY744_03410 [Deltaproteobacteria bacterium]|nr:hypothetical protein [Deltaproteobacteria bacterium]